MCGLLGSLLGEELLFLAVDDIFASVEVALVRAHALALGEELVAEDEGQIERDANVACDEVLIVTLVREIGDEGVEVLGDGHEHADEQSNV